METEGCGKTFYIETYPEKCGEYRLCPSCSPQSPHVNLRRNTFGHEDKPGLNNQKYEIGRNPKNPGTQTLSDKIDLLEKTWSWLLAPDYEKVHYKVMDDVRKDIKEFIKKLKESLCQRPIKGKPCNICINCIEINGEFGEKLIK